MKILHVLFSMKYGGIETMLVNIANEQVNHSDIYIICINDFYDQTLLDLLDQRVKFVKIGRPVGSRNPWYIIKMNYLIWKINPDVIHSHHLNIKKYIVSYKRTNTILTFHDTPVKKPKNIIQQYKKIVSISESVCLDLKKFGFDSVVIANGIQTNSFMKRNNKIRYPNNNVFKIIQLGRLDCYKKGHDITIQACKHLVNVGVTNFHIYFIGTGNDEKKLRMMIHKYCLDDYFTFLGARQPQYIQETLKDYDLFIQPSRIEGFGLTVVEAMAAKVPVLVSGQEGPMEIIEKGNYGFYFENENTIELANKIKEIMFMDAIQLENVATKALKRAEEFYSVKRTANEYIELYSNIIN